MKKSLILFSFLLSGFFHAGAQQYAHLNFGNLISLMPETEAANAELEAFQKQLVAEGEKMAEQFQKDYGEFVVAVQGGDLAPKDQQLRQQQLQKKQQEIQAYEQKVIQDVQAKRDELLGPIIDKAQKAIGEVAKEKGYKMVFDTSSFNSVLFAQDSLDILELVKAKLGISGASE